MNIYSYNYKWWNDQCYVFLTPVDGTVKLGKKQRCWPVDTVHVPIILFIPSPLVSSTDRQDTWNFEPFVRLALDSPQNPWSFQEKIDLPWFTKILTMSIFAIRTSSPSSPNNGMMALFWCSLCLKQDGWWSEAGDDELPTMQCTYAFEQRLVELGFFNRR